MSEANQPAASSVSNESCRAITIFEAIILGSIFTFEAILNIHYVICEFNVGITLDSRVGPVRIGTT